MNKITVDFNKETRAIKPMHSTNNGPIKGTGFGGQKTSIPEFWKQAGIPYARNHDAAFCAAYGGEHTVDITNIFPDFDKDPYDENSYDFIVTDEYIRFTLECGTQTFYRLGQKIDHRIKKYDPIPPKDFKKWAVICEHIIRHYNEGWANGFNYGIEYWEIWNEPDLDPEDATNKRTWTGTQVQFFELYETAATYLKNCFPNLKIGGPACAFREPWFIKFLNYITRDGKKVPLDFFSWHCYGSTPEKMFDRSKFIRNKLDEFGFTETESILNEWNYIKSWDEFIYSVKQVISIKGAAFTAACMCGAQSLTDIDMLMYYDARPCAYNGLFDFYTKEPLKGYYPFRMFNTLYSLGKGCECITEGDNIYAAAAKDEKGNSAVMFSYFIDDDNNTADKIIELDIEGGKAEYQMYLLDKDHSEQLMGNVSSKQTITLTPNSVVLLK